MKAILLARVSTEEQKEAGNSIPAQTFRLRKYAKDKGLSPLQEFEFDESAYKTNREEFSGVIKALKESKEPTALCCDKIDRLIRNFTRDLATLEDLRKEGRIELHFPSDNIILHKDSPAADLFRFTMGVSLAKYYSDSIRDNVKRAFEQKIRNGEWPGRAPVGYMNIALYDDKRDIKPDPDRQMFIRKAFELYASDNHSLSSILKILTDEGFTNKPPLCKPITKSQLDWILKNPFYYGEMDWEGTLYPHRYKPLIDRWLFEKCKEVRDSRSGTKIKYKSKPFVLRGLIKCAYCGCMITADMKKGKYIYLACNQYKGKCGAIRIRDHIVLDQIKDILEKLRMPAEVMEDIKEQLQKGHEHERFYNQAAIDHIHHEYDQVTARLKVMYEDRLDGRITGDEYDKIVIQYKQKQYDLNLQLEDHTKADESFLINASYLLELADRTAELFALPDDSSKVPLKRQLLSFLLSNLKLEGEKLLFTLKEPFNVLYQASTSQNWLRRSDSNRRPMR